MDKEEREKLTARMTLARSISAHIKGISGAIEELPDWDLSGIEGQAKEQTAEAVDLMRKAAQACDEAAGSLDTEASRLKELIDQDQVRIAVTIPREIYTELVQIAAISTLKGEGWTINEEAARHLEQFLKEHREKAAEWEEKNL